MSADPRLAGIPKVHAFGCDIDAIGLDATVDAVARVLERPGPPVQHVSVNALKVVMMRDDPEFARIVGECSLANADGQSVVWGCGMLGRPLPERVAGIDLFGRLVSLAAERGYRVFLLGARPEVVERTAEVLQERNPGLLVSGTRDGYFDESAIDSVVEQVRASGADMLFVAMPSPAKELFLSRTLPDLRVAFAMGVGGSFDVVAGVTDRAPRWMQRFGLEWSYRLIQEPGRMWRRALVVNARFVWILLGELLKREGG